MSRASMEDYKVAFGYITAAATLVVGRKTLATMLETIAVDEADGSTPLDDFVHLVDLLHQELHHQGWYPEGSETYDGKRPFLDI